MEREEARRADALDRYWDAVLRGEAPDRPVEVGAPAAEVIARLVARLALPGLDVAHQRGRGDLLARIEAEAKGRESRLDGTTLLTIRAPGGSPNGRITPLWWRGLLPVLPARKERRRWALAQLATAALLLLTLGGIFLTFGGGRQHRVAAPGTPAPTADVPLYRGDPARTGINPGPGPASAPGVRWRTVTNGPVEGFAAVVDGVVYSTAAGEGLLALDAATGA